MWRLWLESHGGVSEAWLQFWDRGNAGFDEERFICERFMSNALGLMAVLKYNEDMDTLP